MKILVMGNNALMGGLIVHYIVLSKYLRKAGHTLLLININDNGTKILNDQRITEIAIPYKTDSFQKKVGKYFKLRKACKVARSFKPDLFIATGYGHGYSMVASRLEPQTFKFFEEVHFEPHNIPLKLKMVNLFDAIAPQTEGMVEVFKKNVSAKKPVTYLPCFSKEYKVNEITPLPGISSDIKLAYFGRLEWNKGIKQFIQATYKIFQNQHLTLDIYGKGSEGDAIAEEIGKRGLQDKIKLKGYYDDANFADIMSSLHGVIIPSVDTEGLPLVVIETMRYGRPILCTDIGAMPEVALVNNQGMLVSRKEPEELNDTLKIFIEMIRTEKFSAEVINKVYKDHFSNEAFWNVWKEMLGNPRNYFYKN